MATNNKKTAFNITGNGVYVFYGFLTKKQYDQFLKNGIDDESIEDIVDCFGFSGVLSNQMKVVVDKILLEDLDEIGQHFPVKTYPEKYPIPFTKSKKYALVSIEYERGEWVDASITVKDRELVEFENRYYDINASIGLEFFITNVSYQGIQLEQGELDARDREFYLINGDDFSVTQVKLT
jgi:adenine-specific DNA methylase